MSYFREVLYLQTKNEGIGVGYIKRDQKGNKRRERIVFTGFLQSGVGEYKGEIHYVQEEAVHFLVGLQDGRGEVALDCLGESDTLPQIMQITVGDIVVYENAEAEDVVIEPRKAEENIRVRESALEEIARKESEPSKEPETEMKKSAVPKETIKKHTVIGNKWEHICSIYPQKEPFGDGKRFIKVGLSDFVILNEECYALAQNSFLLHGYYNYGYLVLHRSEAGKYFIGTPGTYYEKEKEVAILYDFTHFECKDDDAKEGTFGYYMIPVKL